jgi:ABC-type uncharacterized transport system involved in gliding motility auxiliary subunit
VEIGKKRRLKYGINAVLLTLGVAVAVVLIYALMERYRVRLDFTQHKEFSFSEQTNRALNSLNREVRITAFMRRGNSLDEALIREKVNDVLTEYQARNSKIDWQMVDPDVDIEPAVQYQITTDGTIVFQSGPNRKDVYKSQLFGYSKSFVGESLFTNAILKVTRDRQDELCFLGGHGERSVNDITPTGLNEVRGYLQKNNYKVDTFTLVTTRKVPLHCDLLVIFAPEKQLPPEDDESIRDWVKQGRKLLLFLEPYGPLPLPLTSQYLGLESKSNLVIDSRKHFVLGPQYPSPVMQGHEVTRDLAGVTPVFATARGLVVTEMDGFESTAIMKTTPQAWEETELSGKTANLDPQDIKGPLTLAWALRKVRKHALSETEPSETIFDKKNASSAPRSGIAPAEKVSSPLSIIVGDADFASNGWLKSPGNVDLFLNMVGWLIGDENQITIRPSAPEFRNLTLTAAQTQFVFYFAQFCYPAVVLAIGGFFLVRRRNR